MRTHTNITQHFAAELFIFFVLICFFSSCVVDAQIPLLPEEEVNALREIADQMGKKDWNFSLNPCDNNTNWVTPKRADKYNSTVYCNCTAHECHVTHIILKFQDLAGVLPPSLGKLPYITYIDFFANYLNGTIPREWASTKLTLMSLGMNRLSGPIPEYLGDISTLVYMSLENNLFTGHVPSSLGKLTDLVNLILSTNNLTGGLPNELSYLTKLTELRLSSNKFVGRLPSFQNWMNLRKLEIQGSGLEGPIPDSISLLTNLTELRISDLNGESSRFPQLKYMVQMQRLMLRSCNISGTIPRDLSEMSQLQILDLSFNKLNGEIPDFGSLTKLENVYLTSNFLTGAIPTWIQNPNPALVVDLSYNNLSKGSPYPACRDNLNMFRSFNERSTSEPSRCLHSCTQNWYSFYVNCAGKDVTIGNNNYEADEDSVGSTKFVHSKDYWGSSSTGHFWDVNKTISETTARNISVLQVDNAELYQTARVSPSSVTYYGRCLANGNYTVKLHFAEITFTNNQSFRSLGRRIFDIYIQDELRWKEFDIEEQAGGISKAVIKEFKAVVKSKTLEIRFQWAGRGTTAVPQRGNSGPLISAISVKSDFDPPSNERKKILIIAAAVSSCVILIVMFIFWWKGYFGGRNSSEKEWRALDLKTGMFTLKQIKVATKNFAPENKIGEGGFGSVYKGVLLDGTIIAVKQLSSTSKQGNREFVNEVGMISGLQHPNLVKLYGCCIEGRQLLLVYEYMENNCLARALFGPEQSQLKLDWATRQRVCLGLARGLAFLHEESAFKVVHRDIKATNVLLDGELNPKISDFGLAKLDDEENTHISTRVAGTIFQYYLVSLPAWTCGAAILYHQMNSKSVSHENGPNVHLKSILISMYYAIGRGYMAPEYALWGYLTYKADVYSFGVVALEIVAGKSNMNYRSDENYVCLLDKALVLQQKGNLLELVDPNLASHYNIEEAIRMVKVALLCTNPSPALRPTMSAVVSMLEGEINIYEVDVDPNIYGDELKFKSLRDKYDEMKLKNSSETETLVHSSEVAYNGSSSTSAKDLYSVNL